MEYLDFHTHLKALRLKIFCTFWTPLNYKVLESLKYAFWFSVCYQSAKKSPAQSPQHMNLPSRIPGSGEQSLKRTQVQQVYPWPKTGSGCSWSSFKRPSGPFIHQFKQRGFSASSKPWPLQSPVLRHYFASLVSSSFKVHVGGNHA